MKASNEKFAIILKNFLTIYLLKNRSCSSNTVKSYTETIRLFIRFLNDEKKVSIKKITMNSFSRENVEEFLKWLENCRKCSRSTQHQRLNAIKSFLHYAEIADIEYISVASEVNKLKLRKPPKKIVEYLTDEALSELLRQPDIYKRSGMRDMVLMSLMYDTAARCQEMVDLKIGDLILDKNKPCVMLTGKGSKTRVVPIMEKTYELLMFYLEKYHPRNYRKNDDYVFFTYSHFCNHRMSEDNVSAFMKKYGKSGKNNCSSMPERVHPHQLRHTRAIHLYRSGMPMTLLSEYLGHSNTETTKIYAYSDAEMKREAIRKANADLPLKNIPVDDNIDYADFLNKLCGLN